MINQAKKNELERHIKTSSIPERDRIMLLTRFGIYDGIYRTREETAKIFNVSYNTYMRTENQFKTLIAN